MPYFPPVSSGGSSQSFPYISGNYYLPLPPSSTSSQLYTNGTLVCRMGFFKGLATVDTLGASIQIVSSGGNFQVAIYALDANQLPTGTPLAKTANLSTTSLGAILGTVNTGTPFQFGSSINATTPYAFAIMVDATAGGVAGFTASSNTQTNMTTDFGSDTAAHAMPSGSGYGSLSLTGQTFGTWPNLTAAGFTRNNFGGPIPMFHLSSVP